MRTLIALTALLFVTSSSFASEYICTVNENGTVSTKNLILNSVNDYAEITGLFYLKLSSTGNLRILTSASYGTFVYGFEGTKTSVNASSSTNGKIDYSYVRCDLK